MVWCVNWLFNSEWNVLLANVRIVLCYYIICSYIYSLYIKWYHYAYTASIIKFVWEAFWPWEHILLMLLCFKKVDRSADHSEESLRLKLQKHGRTIVFKVSGNFDIMLELFFCNCCTRSTNQIVTFKVDCSIHRGNQAPHIVMQFETTPWNRW